MNITFSSVQELKLMNITFSSVQELKLMNITFSSVQELKLIFSRDVPGSHRERNIT